jgi:hypothetical protein
VPGKCAAEKGQLPDSVSVGTTSRTTQRPARSYGNAQNSARCNPLISYVAMAFFHVWLDWETHTVNFDSMHILIPSRASFIREFASARGLFPKRATIWII